MKDQLQAKWNKLDASKRRWIGVAAMSAAGLFLLYILLAVTGQTGPSDQEAVNQDVSRDLLTDSSARDMGLSSLNSKVERLKGSREQLANQVESLKKQIRSLRQQGGTQKGDEDGSDGSEADRVGPDEVTQRKINKLTAQIETLRQKIDAQENAERPQGEVPTTTIGDDGGEEEPPEQTPSAKSGPTYGVERNPFKNDQEASGQTPSASGPPQSGTSGQKGNASQREQSSASQQQSQSQNRIAFISGSESGPGSAGDGGGEQTDQGVFIPAGSMITGTLLTGMDAPTGSKAKDEPTPALLRVKHEAILPNRYRADVRECFLVASGYGSISSTRVKMRSETLSCIREDGGVVEAGLGAWAVSGKDGKEGIEGRLVNRQGQVLGRSMLAGFMSGFSQLFGQARVPTLQTNPDQGGAQPYQQVMSDAAVQSASIKGAGQALERLAQFYIDMAEDMFPVIEVNPGRRVTFVVNKGTQLKIQTPK